MQAGEGQELPRRHRATPGQNGEGKGEGAKIARRLESTEDPSIARSRMRQYVTELPVMYEIGETKDIAVADKCSNE